MISRLRLLTAVVGLGTLACREAVVLEDPATGLRLAYHCAQIVVQAESPAEMNLVRGYGERIGSSGVFAPNFTLADSLLAADARGDWSTFERTVVEELCSKLLPVRPLTAVAVAGRAERPGLQPGSRAPDFRLPLLSVARVEGAPDQLALSELRGQWVVMTFWATWCGPCMEEYPALVTIAEEFRSRGVTVLGVLHKDSEASAVDYMATRQDGTFTTVVDRNERVADSYLVRGIPRTLVIDPKGVIVEAILGWGPGATEHLRAILEEQMAEGDGDARAEPDPNRKAGQGWMTSGAEHR